MSKRNELRSFTPEEQRELEKLSRSRTAAQQHVERAIILLRYATGEPIASIAAAVQRRPETIWKVVKWFNQRGMDSLHDIPRSGRPVTYGEDDRGRIIMTAKTHPQQLDLPYGHWTLNRLTEYVNHQLHLPISRSQLGAILEQEGLKWYQEKTYFTERPAPQFAEKRAIVSLYKAPPAETHVICIDEMGPVSAKTYPAPRWSMQRPLLTPDYGRRAKTWVFGAFEPATGQAFTLCAAGRGACYFLTFLNQLAAQWPEGQIILIMDNLASHKTLDVRLWALAHPRVRFLFQPTYAPWLNLIEPWWKTLRSLALKGRRFETKDELHQAIAHATVYWNQHRIPYIWRKTT